VASLRCAALDWIVQAQVPLAGVHLAWPTYLQFCVPLGPFY